MKNIIFDLDGTLWDATFVTVDAWKNIFDRHPESTFNGIIDHETVCSYMGLAADEVAKLLFGDSAEGKLLMDECCDVENELLWDRGGILYENVEETVKLLHNNGYRLCIVSNCQDGYIETFLHAHGLSEYFVDIESCGRTGLDKAENIRLIMERNRFRKAVYVGDTDGDGRAARAAGIPFIYVKYGFGEIFGRGRSKDHDASIENISELEDTIAKLFGK